ncbi:S8 family serine peptidase [Nonomuraea sp. MG754425]|uniref:S8 family peptidase n=1 Tax=Nonomuraea sp. MG754425 TaxID=2570319 RepID=UPI001F014ADF|nr:S8 family serine peptidase [Nonomuraea sp. MG754425]
MTLITGDRVVVTGQGHRVEPGPGRQVDFSSQVRRGHLYVIPSDAAPLLAQGVLDRRLFDVTQLLAWRYGDADTPDIPVIEQGVTTPLSSLQVRRLSSLGMSAVRVSKADAAQTWRTLTGARTLVAGRTKLWLDGRRSFSLDESVKQIGAPQAWQQGLTGKGVTVTVLDTGYDPDHPDLKDAVTQERNFSDEPDMRDNHGHGTHVASIAAGRGEKYRGVAPEASLAIGKVGGAAGLTESAALAGMEWAAVEVKAKIVNMSFGGVDDRELDPLEQAVNTLSEQYGTLFVAAAGNVGREQSVYSPASGDAALAVGAVDKQGRMADLSSQGPRVGDHAIKPDLTAPGVEITAAAVGGGYVSESGTSMATPHVAGVAAILAQRHPDWTGAQLKAALIGSASPADGVTPYQQGAGLTDLTRVLKQHVVAKQANLWAPFAWDGDERVTTKTLTYVNSGDAPIDLDLSAQGEVLKLPTGKVTVPAKGDASVTLAIDATGKAPGDYPGTVTAKAGDTVVRTLVGAYVEPESYDVTVTAAGRQGQPVEPWMGEIYDPATGTTHELSFRDGSATVRLPTGDWNLFSAVNETVDGKRINTVADSPFHVEGGDQQLTVDTRQGKPVTITLDDPSAKLKRGYDLGLEHGAWNNWWTAGGADANSELFVVPVRWPGLTYTLSTTWLSKDVSPSPYVYSIVDRRTDGIPEDPTFKVRQQDLAKVTATYRASGVAATGAPMAILQTGQLSAALLRPLVGEIPLPGELIHYRTRGLTYGSGLETGTSLIFDGGRLAQRGQTSEVWNAAAIGPSFLLPGGSRTGDKLTFSAVGMFADGQPGRSGSDTAATGTATLAKNGKVLAAADLAGCVVGQSGGCELRADLPAGSGGYALTASMRRQATLSTEVNTAWTFPSATTAKEQPLPLMAVRYSPEGLDGSNRARPGSTTRIPVWVERNPGSTKAEAKSIRLEMSADDGATWHHVPVTRTGSGWTATLTNPPAAGFVSLRAVVTDTAGNGVTQTITRAYAVG